MRTRTDESGKKRGGNEGQLELSRPTAALSFMASTASSDRSSVNTEGGGGSSLVLWNPGCASPIRNQVVPPPLPPGSRSEKRLLRRRTGHLLGKSGPNDQCPPQWTRPGRRPAPAIHHISGPAKGRKKQTKKWRRQGAVIRGPIGRSGSVAFMITSS